ncbi:MAG: leucine--tRNA ligase [Christensenellales bacterium]|jgi:leucyl-tRNA synthetase
MDHNAIEAKWQKKWQQTRLYSFKPERVDKKHYVLEMFSYPSAAKLHLGHWYNYGPSDSYARFKRMQGYEVFQPMGFDAFGLPAENYAIKTGIHPQDSTIKNIETMEQQLKAIGATFDWDYELTTCSPDYYKWTQWCFLELYKHGLAYRKAAPVNWCPSCNTVLANEQVIEGACERCSSGVTKKNLTQWFFKITQYADELLDCLDDLDWPEKTKQMQRNWIGRSTGGEVRFKLKNSDRDFTVFTTRPDTLFGCTYAVIAPEHPLVEEITLPEHKAEVAAYRESSLHASEIDRLSITREKTGVFTGAYAINPINGREIPVWVADYVLYTYGTGCVMAVPAHDERDFEFATKYSLPIERVISGDGENDALPFVEYGSLVNSRAFNGMDSEAAQKAILEKLSQTGDGSEKINYRLRDWLVSRQRYWGAPIPIIHCEHCGEVPVDEKDLPVLLPYDVDFTPDGTSPLLKSDEFINVPCPKCNAPARRDADTMDTFVCSSWYFLRYPDNRNSEKAWDKDWINRMLPVDKYIGGSEHACMHLLYARFFVKALRDMGHLDFDEPFTSLLHQGIILGPDGNRMSKSHGNVVSPDEYVSQYGADTFRLYLMFGFNYIEGGPWSDDGIKGVYRFLERIERLLDRVEGLSGDNNIGAAEKEVGFALHTAIRQVTADIDRFQFNTAIARIMELVNAMYKYLEAGGQNKEYMADTLRLLTLIIAPFAPHFAEEIWEQQGYEYSVFNQQWPKYDEAALIRDSIEMAVQINGKVRSRIELDSSLDEEGIKAAVLNDEKVIALIGEGNVKKVIVIKGRLINIVVN